MSDAQEYAARSIQQPERLPPASLIICSRNRPDFLEKAVASILSGEQIPAELIIVDQSDLPNARLSGLATSRSHDVRYLWTRSVGLSRAINEGIVAARHELLVFTHDDIYAPSNWFGTLVRALVAAGPQSVVTGQVLPAEAELPGAIAPTINVDRVAKIYQGRIGQDVLFSLNMAMRKNAIEHVGLFDERLGPGTRFPGGEDNDFGLRLLEANYRILYVPEAALYHRAWRTSRLGLRWSYGRGQGGYFAKHLSLRDLYMAKRAARSLRKYLRQALRRARREPADAAGDAIYAAGVICGGAEWLLTVATTARTRQPSAAGIFDRRRG